MICPACAGTMHHRPTAGVLECPRCGGMFLCRTVIPEKRVRQKMADIDVLRERAAELSKKRHPDRVWSLEAAQLTSVDLRAVQAQAEYEQTVEYAMASIELLEVERLIETALAAWRRQGCRE